MIQFMHVRLESHLYIIWIEVKEEVNIQISLITSNLKS